MLVVFRHFVPKGYRSITIFPFIFLLNEKDKKNAKLVNHESIHLKQQLELLVIPFFIWYGIEFIVRYFQHKNWKRAYRSICFEREAYGNEKDMNYLKKRPFWIFIKYLN